MYRVAIFRHVEQLLSATHLGTPLEGCSQSPGSLAVMRVTHFGLQCPPLRLVFLALAPESSFQGCYGNQVGWPQAVVRYPLDCLPARFCAACLPTGCGLVGGAKSAEELLVAGCGCCLLVTPPRDSAPAVEDVLSLSPGHCVALSHSAPVSTGAQAAACHPLSRSPPHPSLPTMMGKGKLNPDLHFIREGACRAQPAQVSVGPIWANPRLLH